MAQKFDNGMNMNKSNIQILLYTKKQDIPDIVWTREDVYTMIDSIDLSDKYLKTIWGDWMKARDKLILAIMYEHALRPKETLYLRFDDFNREEHTIKIQGKNNKQGKPRILPISKKISPYIQAYFSFPPWMWKSSPYLFPSAEHEVLSPGRWKTIMREKILKPLGLYISPCKPQFSKTRSYTLRHSRATELLNKTKDIYLVANVLGHADISSTTCYLHKTKEYMNYVKEAINS